MLTTKLQFSTYIDKGLLTFDHLGDQQNGIPLCPSCHRAFDDINNPGLVFVPTELYYFIEFEEKDHENRREIARRLGHVPPRLVPTPQMYSEHLKRRGLLSQDDSGGLNWRYTLRDYFPVNADKTFIPGLGPFKEPGIWHGAPMAALKRAFQILGDPSVEGITEEQLESLWKLRKLYSRKLLAIDTTNSDLGSARSGIALDCSGQTQVAALSGADSDAALPTIPQVTQTGAFEHEQNTRHSGNTTTAPATYRTSHPRAPFTSKGVSLLRFGSAGTADMNVQRYLTMMVHL